MFQYASHSLSIPGRTRFSGFPLAPFFLGGLLINDGLNSFLEGKRIGSSYSLKV